MPYARKNWTTDELDRLLQNPVDGQSGPHPHSKIHAVKGELASHPMFQHARVMNLVAESRKGKIVMVQEARKHSTMDSTDLATGLAKVLNHDKTQPLLMDLDTKRASQDASIKFFANFNQSIGRAMMHSQAGVEHFDCVALFVYLKPNPGNADLPIFQTVVPYNTLQKSSTGPKETKVILV